nr:hypothetical protein 14 [bacterium]
MKLQDLSTSAQLLDHYISRALVTAKAATKARREGNAAASERLSTVSKHYMLKVRVLQGV